MAKSADAFRTISEVAEWLGVQTHVLRFWESKFSQVKPVKRAGGRRYYRPTDMLLLGGIRKLLHEDGLTIKGVQKVLREEGMAFVADMSPPLDAETDAQLDADLIAPIEENVTQPAIEAEIVPFTSGQKQETAAEDETPPTPKASEGPEIVEATGQSLPSFMRAPTSPKQDTEAEADVASGLPFPPLEEDVRASRVRSPEPAEPEAKRQEAAPEAAEEQIAAENPNTAESASGLPSFLSDYATSANEPTPAAPRPRVIDVPDDPDPSAIDVAPSALSRSIAVTKLTDVQRDMLKPLLAQLTALRDQMASNRRDTR
ncbi:MAG: MerR family transcriptional regulator [Pseudomonadota bacterium]